METNTAKTASKTTKHTDENGAPFWSRTTLTVEQFSFGPFGTITFEVRGTTGPWMTMVTRPATEAEMS